MVGWHHRLNVHEFEQSLGFGDGQGGLVCCSPWGRKESDTTERVGQDSIGIANGQGETTQQRGPHHHDLISCQQCGPCPAHRQDW